MVRERLIHVHVAPGIDDLDDARAFAADGVGVVREPLVFESLEQHGSLGTQCLGALRFVERVERLEEEKKALSDDIRDVYAEAKANGFDVKALRQVVRLRKQDADERKEQEAILETYLQALGML